MSYYSLPRVILNENKETKKLNNLSSNYSCLLGTSEYANDIQSDIDLFVTRGRFNEASVRHKLNPIVKSVLRTENPLAFLFKDVVRLIRKIL